MQTRFACHCYESPISTGMFGGYPAACNTRRMLKNASVRKSIDAGRIPYDTIAITGELQHLPAKIKGGIDFTKEDYHEATPSAGGGWGDPIEREATLVAEDVRTNAVSREAAREIYGVVVDTNASLDARATEARRAEMRAERLSWPQKKVLSNAPANGAPGDVLALFGDRAKFVRVAGRNYLRCDCGCAMAPAEENWKDYARQTTTTAAELGPRIALHEELEAIRYACPSCARLHWVEIKLKSEDPLYDMELSL
jgi:N-methylhydantoinase B